MKERLIKRPAAGENFCGRESEIKNIIEWLDTNDIILIQANPRSGKTSLLRKLAELNIGPYVNASSYNPNWSYEDTVALFQQHFKTNTGVILIDEADSAFRNLHFMELIKFLQSIGFKIIWASVAAKEIPDNYPTLKHSKKMRLMPYKKQK